MRIPMFKTMAIVIVFLTVVAATVPAQVTHYVREINPEAASPFTTWDTAATNIADAVTAANTSNAGDTVLISNGVYHLTSEVSIQNTIVRGASGDRTAIVINGLSNDRCFSLSHANAVLADLTVSNGTVSSVGGGGVYVTSGTISNCVITKCQTSSSGGGIRLISGLVTDCLVTSNTSDFKGGGVYLTGAGSLLRNSVIAGNATCYSGGGVTAVKNSLVTNCLVSGNCTANSNSSRGGGGAEVGAAVRIADCVISNNWVPPKAGGAGIFFSGNATASWCTVVCNTNAYVGGGIFLYATGTNVVEYCTITGNVCSVNGGGITVRSSDSLIRGSVIRGNTAGSNGGGINMHNGTVSNCVIADNWARYAGGIYAAAAPNVLITHSTISNNTHGGGYYGGGGMWIYDGGMIRDCVICDNQTTNPAAVGGGGVYLRDISTNDEGVNTTVFRNCLFTGNSATNGNGGGLYLYNNPKASVQNCTISGNSGDSGGGIYCNNHGRIENTILYDNSAVFSGSSNWFASGTTTFTNCCAAPVSATFNAASTDQAPGYDAHYRLLPGSPCINTGVNRDWMEGARDLDGHPRLDRFSGRVDMGCYEYVCQGTLLLIR